MPTLEPEQPGNHTPEHIKLYEEMDTDWLEARRVEYLAKFLAVRDGDPSLARSYGRTIQLLDMVLAARPR